MDDTERGTLLANLTINLFRTCETELTDESFDLFVEELNKDEDSEVLH